MWIESSTESMLDSVFYSAWALDSHSMARLVSFCDRVKSVG
ncbi:hypothetical protein [Helicobacter cinaedi]|uniref:Uncharacterized protein n=1 Tax=Helicobacter cinaedi CCUG 18818 = ATCC BAA-847 TaxID=537971 RepID=A0ABN0BC42_9HELI|nr:hypothetical protein [Helicobacter cinaedi]EFR47136.1 hypothetical protein HCCG_01684 [Helicobacter cinaedi CCUG 18818 = ATCC BAA-847]BBB19334.1 hypothetical protein HC081234_05110 [Helicobacter cinaedi]